MPTATAAAGGMDKLIKREIPGFGQPVQIDGPNPEKAASKFALGPDRVWANDKYAIPVEGAQPRYVNTAVVDAGDQEKISMAELQALGKMASEVPREFFQRLLAASYNKDPATGKIAGVEYSRVQPTEYGDVTMSLKAYKGKLTADVNVVVKDPELDQWLKDYLAAQPRDDGKHTVLDLHAEGELKLYGGLENIDLKASIQGLPYFSINKLLYGDAERDLGAAVAGQAPDGADDAAKKAQDDKEKAGALGVLKDMMPDRGALAEILSYVQKDDPFKLELDTKDLLAKLTGGKMAFALKLLDILSTRKEPDQVEIDAAAKGGVTKRGDEDALGVSEISAKNSQKVHIRFEDGENGAQNPVFEMSEGRKGERHKLKDYAEMGQGLLYMVGSILSGEKPF